MKHCDHCHVDYVRRLIQCQEVICHLVTSLGHISACGQYQTCSEMFFTSTLSSFVQTCVFKAQQLWDTNIYTMYYTSCTL